MNCAVLSVFDFQYSEAHVDFRSARSFIGIVLFVISGAVCDLTHCALKYLECLSISLYQKHGCIFHLFFPLGILRFSQRYITTVIILSLRFQVKTFCLYREVSHFNLTYGFILQLYVNCSLHKHYIQYLQQLTYSIETNWVI